MALSLIQKTKRKTTAGKTAKNGQRPLVLYVEDNEDNWELTRLFLKEKFDLHHASTDESACRFVCEHAQRISAILMDIELQGCQLNGIELTRLFRGKPMADSLPEFANDMPALGCPLFFVTAYGDRYSKQELSEAGGDKVIDKPVNFEILSAALTHTQLIGKGTALEIIEATTSPDVNPRDVRETFEADEAYISRVKNAVAQGALRSLRFRSSSAPPPIYDLSAEEHRYFAICFAVLALSRQNGSHPLLHGHILRRAAIMKHIATQLGSSVPKYVTTGFLLDSGLLSRAEHDIEGALDIARSPAKVRTTREAAGSEGEHTKRGRELAMVWGLSPELVRAIESHHAADPPEEALARAAWICEFIAGVFEAGDPRKNMELARQAVKRVALDSFSLDDTLEAVPSLVLQMASVFGVEVHPQADLETLLLSSTELSQKMQDLYFGLIDQLDHVVKQKDVLAARLRETNLRLSGEAATDALTRIDNRGSFDKTLERDLSHAARKKLPLSLIILDIDHFKSVNDTHGHPVGDVLLTKMADFFVTNKRNGDFVARYGGEEFAFILRDATLEQARKAGERLRTGIENHLFDIHGTRLRITVSIGVSCIECHQGSDQASQLIQAADQALYEAKRSGRNRVCTNADLQ